jgi:hypothetical protein
MATFLFAALIFGEAAAVSYLVALPRLMGSYLPCIVLTFLLFPIFVLSCLENDSPFVPVAMPVLRSFKTVWWAWWLFYLYTSVLLVGWAFITLLFLASHQFFSVYLSVFIYGPLLAVVMMIYTRLLGRLIWCASQEETEDD